ncbi:MAG: hypothetical protein WCS72_05330 [Deltaproteobacteria bacterium]
MRSFLRATAAAVTLLALSSCTGTRMVQTWRDPKYQAQPVKRVFIVAIMPNDRTRVVFENTVAQALLDRGILSATATGTFPPGELDKEKAIQFVKDNKIDLVIVQHFKKKTELAYLPGSLDYVPAAPYYGGWWSAYGTGNGFYYSSAYLEEDTTVTAETMIYSAHTDPETLVWSAASTTQNAQNAPGVAQSLTKVLMADLDKAGILVK